MLDRLFPTFAIPASMPSTSSGLRSRTRRPPSAGLSHASTAHLALSTVLELLSPEAAFASRFASHQSRCSPRRSPEATGSPVAWLRRISSSRARTSVLVRPNTFGRRRLPLGAIPRSIWPTQRPRAQRGLVTLEREKGPAGSTSEQCDRSSVKKQEPMLSYRPAWGYGSTHAYTPNPL